MARYTGPVCRFCRREGCKLFLKGDRCYTAKCAFSRKPVAPGQHGQSRKKPSEYNTRLREKQKVKRAYGMMESQFHSYFKIAQKNQGVTGVYMLSLLERRLDNVIYRMGIGVSRAQARQMVLHGHITVNGQKVDIPSFRVSLGDEIAVKAASASTERFKEIANQTGKIVPKWLSYDAQNLRGSVVALPEREDTDLTIEENLIVESYSR